MLFSQTVFHKNCKHNDIKQAKQNLTWLTIQLHKPARRRKT